MIEPEANLTTTIEIPLSEELVRELDSKASTVGLGRDEFIQGALARAAKQPRSFDEILKPFRDQVDQSGISDEELDAMFLRARSDVARAKSDKR